MPTTVLNGIRLSWSDFAAQGGASERGTVLMVTGTGATGRVWDLYQVPALTEAGYRVVTFTNRGMPPSDECAEGFTLADLVADTAALIEQVAAGPCRVVGTSLGAHVAQELALARPDLVSQAVLMATRGRTDAMRAALSRADIDLRDSGLRLPGRYAAVIRAQQNLSPRTLSDDTRVADWLDLLEMTGLEDGPGVRAQLELDQMPDRLGAYRQIRVPCHVIAFEDDLIAPPHLGREVAGAIPGATFEVVSATGHFGYLERPEAVTAALLAGLGSGVRVA